ncbi:MAG: restriction endonuclease subunit S [Nitrospinae bacterium]|nr:restriction endonuclease subunit S [Nitrospinota bacterium]
MNINEDGKFVPDGTKYISEDEYKGREDYALEPGDVLFNNTNSKELIGKTCLIETPVRGGFSNHMTRIRVNRDLCVPRFLALLLHSAWRKGQFMERATRWIGQAGINIKTLSDFQIPLPPLEVQKEIVAEIEGYQKVIDGARAVLDHYRPHISIHPDWPILELSEVIQEKPRNGYSGKPVDRVTKLKVLSLSATTSGRLDLTKCKYLDEDISRDSPYRCKKGDIYLQRGNTAELVGTAALFDVEEENYIYPDLMIRVRADERKILSQYLLVALQSEPVRAYLKRNATGAAGSMPKINQDIVGRIPLKLPPLATQRRIVAEIEGEQALVAGNRELIARFEKKIQATLARVWGGDETPPAAG